MKNLLQRVKNYISSIKSVILRKKKAKKEEEDDPFIYPHF